MDTNLVARVARLERRVGMLERLAGVDTPTVEEAAPERRIAPPRRTPPAPLIAASPVPPVVLARPVVVAPATPRPLRSDRASRPSAPVRDLERFVGVSILGRVGVAALLLAVGYFMQWTYARIPPPARVLMIYGLAALLVGVGVMVRRRVAPTYVGILWGGGTAIAYLAGLAARLRYDLVDPTTALAMLVIAVLLGETLARQLRAQGLAVLALVGAAAAPLLVGWTSDARTMLLVYLLVVHGWGTSLEITRGWKVARLAGLCATIAVASIWAVGRGGLDLSTGMHVHTYLLGFTAAAWVPSLVRRIGATPFPKGLGVTLLVLQGVLGVAAASGSPALRQAFGPGMGLVWGLVAVVALPTAAWAGTFHRWAARLAAVALVIGAVVTFEANRLPWVNDTLPILLLGAVAMAALGFRRWVGVGDGAALAAGIVGVLTLSFDGLAAPGAWSLAALVPGLCLVASGSTLNWRLSGLVVAAVAAWAANHPTEAIAGDFEPVWAFGTVALVVCFASVGRPLRTAPGASLAPIAAWILGTGVAMWTLAALWLPWGAVTTSLVNPVTVAALILLGACAFVARYVPREPGAVGAARLMLVVAALALVIVSVGREVRHVTSSVLPRDVTQLIETAAFVVVALVMAVVAGRRASRFLPVAAGLPWMTAFVRALGILVADGGAWTAAAQVVLVALPPLVFAAVRRTTDVVVSVAVLVGLGGACVLFAGAWDAGRFDVAHLVTNARFVAGAALVIMLAWARTRVSVGREALTIGAVVVSVVVAVPEVMKATEGLERLELRHACLSVYGALHAAAVLAIGFLRRDRLLRYLALAGFGVVALKVGMWDLASAETSVRVLVTGSLGAVLLSAAYAYSRRAR